MSKRKWFSYVWEKDTYEKLHYISIIEAVVVDVHTILTMLLLYILKYSDVIGLLKKLRQYSGLSVTLQLHTTFHKSGVYLKM